MLICAPSANSRVRRGVVTVYRPNLSPFFRVAEAVIDTVASARCSGFRSSLRRVDEGTSPRRRMKKYWLLVGCC